MNGIGEVVTVISLVAALFVVLSGTLLGFVSILTYYGTRGKINPWERASYSLGFNDHEELLAVWGFSIVVVVLCSLVVATKTFFIVGWAAVICLVGWGLFEYIRWIYDQGVNQSKEESEE